MTQNSADILIVGAGPTGLTLACTLAERGVAFRIVDLSDGPQPGSRGKGLQPRSLELFDDLGIVERVVANGRLGIPVQAYDPAGNIVSAGPAGAPASRPDAPYLATLLTPQWRIEEALRDRLAELGGHVEFGTELVALGQDRDGVSVELETTMGTETVWVRWLVGCDGGKSTVRHLAGIEFHGETLENYRMLVADVGATGLDRDHWHIWRSAEGFFALCPLPSTDLFQLQSSVAPGQESEPSLELFNQLVARRTGRQDIHLTGDGWRSLWRANVRMVDRYRAGNIFLAGDAAHVHSPAGGQGMNTGIQDAYNLGWKLAAVLGGADEALLDSYQDERLPIAAGVLGLSNALMDATVKSGTMTFRRDEQTMQLSLGYRTSSLTRDTRPDAPGLRAGDRAPDAPDLAKQGTMHRMFDLLRGPHFNMLGFGARWQAVIDSCLVRFGDAVRGHVIVAAPGDPAHYVDMQGHARAAYADDALLIVRPDNYIGMATDAADAGAAMSYLERFVAAAR